MQLSDIPFTTSTGIFINESGDFSVAPEKKPPVVNVKSLTETPVIKFKPITESEGAENTWIVDDFESMKNVCSTSKISYRGDTLFMNVCESDGKSTVSLILEIDGTITRVPFVLEKSCNTCGEYDMILSV